MELVKPWLKEGQYIQYTLEFQHLVGDMDWNEWAQKHTLRQRLLQVMNNLLQQ